jgi:mRNA interferase MazF
MKNSIKRSEIWLVNLDSTIGAEIRKTRPAIIINDDSLGILPLKIILPLSDWKERYEKADWMVKIEVDNLNNLVKDSTADCFQVRSVSEKRLVRKIGAITDKQTYLIEIALKKVLDIRE